MFDSIFQMKGYAGASCCGRFRDRPSMLQGLSLGDQDAVAVYAVADRHQRGHYLHEVFQRFVANDQRQSFFRRDVRREGDFDIVPPFEVDDNVFQRRVVEDQTRREPLAVFRASTFSTQARFESRSSENRSSGRSVTGLRRCSPEIFTEPVLSTISSLDPNA